LILGLETATPMLSVAVVQEEGLCAARAAQGQRLSSVRLLPFIQEVLADAGATLQDLTGVAVSIGPGSFTGLRIGLSFAKGLAFTHNLPIVPVPTLMTLALGSNLEKTSLRTFLFSHGDILFHQQFRVSNGEIQAQCEVKAQIWEKILQKLPSDIRLVHYGCGRFLREKGIAKEVTPSAKWVAILAQRYFDEWVVNPPDRLTPRYVSTFQVKGSS